MGIYFFKYTKYVIIITTNVAILMNLNLSAFSKHGRGKLFTSCIEQIRSRIETAKMRLDKGQTSITPRENGNFCNSVTNEGIS